MKTIGSALTFCFLLSVAAYADNLSPGQIIALQNNGFNSVTLTGASDPLLGPTSRVSSGFNLDFEAAVVAPQTLSHWTFTLTLAGEGTFTFSQSAVLTCGSKCVLFQSFALPADIRHPLMGTLNFTFNGVSSGPLPFRFVEPVPELPTLALFITGMGALGFWKYRLAA